MFATSRFASYEIVAVGLVERKIGKNTATFLDIAKLLTKKTCGWTMLMFILSKHNLFKRKLNRIR